MLPQSFSGQNQIVFLLNERTVSHLTLLRLFHRVSYSPTPCTDSHTCISGVKGTWPSYSCVSLNHSMSTGFQCETLHLWIRPVICLNG